MTTQALINTLVAFFLALGGSLVTLWTGVREFSEVAPVAYAVAVVAAIVSSLKDLKSFLQDSPENIKISDEIVKAAAKLDVPIEEPKP